MPTTWLNGTEIGCAARGGAGYLKLKGENVPGGERVYEFDFEQDGALVTPSVVRVTDEEVIGSLEWFGTIRPPFESYRNVRLFGRSNVETRLDDLEGAGGRSEDG